MGEFNSGKWIIALSLYFFVFFLVIHGTVNASNELGLSSGVYYNDPGFLNSDPTNTTGTIQSQVNSTTTEWNEVQSTIGVMTGFRANIGLPAGVQFIFSFLFFYIPFLAYMWAIYMAIPFLH